MARAATTADVFNAIAEPKRRAILDLLVGGERAVSELLARLDVAPSALSKHLGVLRAVGLVRARRDGRRRLYTLDARGLKTVHDWTRTYEQHWASHLRRVKTHAERTASSSQTKAT